MPTQHCSGEHPYYAHVSNHFLASAHVLAM